MDVMLRLLLASLLFRADSKKSTGWSFPITPNVPNVPTYPITGTSEKCAAALHTLWMDDDFTSAQDAIDTDAEGIFHYMLGEGNHSLVNCDTGFGPGTCLAASGDWLVNNCCVSPVVTRYRKAGDGAFDGQPYPGINTVVNGVITIKNFSRPLRMDLWKMTRFYVPNDCSDDDLTLLNDFRKALWERSPSVISANFSLSHY